MEQKDIHELIKSKSIEEKKLRIRSVVVILVIFFAGLIWLFWTNNQVNMINKEIITLNDTIVRISKEITTLNDTIVSKESTIKKLEDDIILLYKELHAADNLKNYKIDISAADIKSFMYIHEVGINLAFKKIIDLQNEEIRFSLHGVSLDQGFNSPAFMSYILVSIGVLESIESKSSNLAMKFNQVNDNYQLGDIIIYKSGYCMMYFASTYPNNNEYDSFVIGMTPFGVLALKPDFAEKVKILRPNYDN